MGKVGLNVFRLTNTIDLTEHILVKSYLDLLPALTGVKRVVIDSTEMTKHQDEYKKFAVSLEVCALYGVWRFFKKFGMLVEFTRGPIYVLHEYCGKCDHCTKSTKADGAKSS